jgi:hypothetical protein
VEALWIVPPAVLALGAVMTIAVLRSVEGAADDIREQLARMAEVRSSVEALRAETARTRASLGALDRR